MPLPTNTHANPAATARRILALLALPVAARANPPPFAPDFALPVTPATEAAAIAELPRRSAAANAHAAWREREGGSDYQPTLTFLRDTPVLMLVTSPREPAERALHRRRAIIQACGFLLEASAFAQAVICVVESDPSRPGAPAVRNHPVRRAEFTDRLRAETGTPDFVAALRTARGNDALTLRLCAALRID
ncbi:MAG: hypothetical protein ACKPB0_02860 [Opitutaceae bacterium]